MRLYGKEQIFLCFCCRFEAFDVKGENVNNAWQMLITLQVIFFHPIKKTNIHFSYFLTLRSAFVFSYTFNEKNFAIFQLLKDQKKDEFQSFPHAV